MNPDKLRGCVYGFVLGDSFAAPYEWKMAGEVIDPIYPRSDATSGTTPGASATVPNQWTEETGIIFVVMRTMLSQEQITTSAMTEAIDYWYCNGIPELEDDCGSGVNGGPIAKMLSAPEWKIRPAETAIGAWEQSKRTVAHNIAVVACMPLLGSATNQHVVQFSRMLSADPIATAASLIYIMVLQICVSEQSIDTCINNARNITASYASSEMLRIKEAVNSGLKGVLLDIGLDRTPTHALRSISCIFYAVKILQVAKKNSRIPCIKKVLMHIVSAGGDTDANCAIIGSIIGAHLGYEALPDDWVVAIPHLTWVHDLITAYVDGVC